MIPRLGIQRMQVDASGDGCAHPEKNMAVAPRPFISHGFQADLCAAGVQPRCTGIGLAGAVRAADSGASNDDADTSSQPQLGMEHRSSSGERAADTATHPDQEAPESSTAMHSSSDEGEPSDADDDFEYDVNEGPASKKAASRGRKSRPPAPKAVANGGILLLGPCNHCGVTFSPQWRKGTCDKPVLCNACGIRLRRHKSLDATPAALAAAAAATAGAVSSLGSRRRVSGDSSFKHRSSSGSKGSRSKLGRPCSASAPRSYPAAAGALAAMDMGLDLDELDGGLPLSGGSSGGSGAFDAKGGRGERVRRKVTWNRLTHERSTSSPAPGGSVSPAGADMGLGPRTGPLGTMAAVGAAAGTSWGLASSGGHLSGQLDQLQDHLQLQASQHGLQQLGLQGHAISGSGIGASPVPVAAGTATGGRGQREAALAARRMISSTAAAEAAADGLEEQRARTHVSSAMVGMMGARQAAAHAGAYPARSSSSSMLGVADATQGGRRSGSSPVLDQPGSAAAGAAGALAQGRATTSSAAAAGSGSFLGQKRSAAAAAAVSGQGKRHAAQRGGRQQGRSGSSRVMWGLGLTAVGSHPNFLPSDSPGGPLVGGSLAGAAGGLEEDEDMSSLLQEWTQGGVVDGLDGLGDPADPCLLAHEEPAVAGGISGSSAGPGMLQAYAGGMSADSSANSSAGDLAGAAALLPGGSNAAAGVGGRQLGGLDHFVHHPLPPAGASGAAAGLAAIGAVTKGSYAGASGTTNWTSPSKALQAYNSSTLDARMVPWGAGAGPNLGSIQGNGVVAAAGSGGGSAPVLRPSWPSRVLSTSGSASCLASLGEAPIPAAHPAAGAASWLPSGGLDPLGEPPSSLLPPPRPLSIELMEAGAWSAAAISPGFMGPDSLPMEGFGQLGMSPGLRLLPPSCLGLASSLGTLPVKAEQQQHQQLAALPGSLAAAGQQQPGMTGVLPESAARAPQGQPVVAGNGHGINYSSGAGGSCTSQQQAALQDVLGAYGAAAGGVGGRLEVPVGLQSL